MFAYSDWIGSIKDLCKNIELYLKYRLLRNSTWNIKVGNTVPYNWGSLRHV